MICKRVIAVVSRRFFCGLPIPFTTQHMFMSKTCDEYEWIDNVNKLRACMNEPEPFRVWYRGVTEMVNVPEEFIP